MVEAQKFRKMKQRQSEQNKEGMTRRFRTLELEVLRWTRRDNKGIIIIIISVFACFQMSTC